MREEKFESLPDKFFSERELLVEFDEIEGYVEASAGNWFKEVQAVLGELPTYAHTNMGAPSQEPDSLQGEEVWFFRGQRDSRWGLHSTLSRVVAGMPGADKLKPRRFEKAMYMAEESMLDVAYANGIGRGLTALETLTLLQHHGSPTRLIDVTSDWKVALYFACESREDLDGRLFLIRINTRRWNDFPKAKDDPKKELVWSSYKENFSNQDQDGSYASWLDSVWPILVSFSDPRMISQRGFFWLEVRLLCKARPA